MGVSEEFMPTVSANLSPKNEDHFRDSFKVLRRRRNQRVNG
jgi:hypothetical protein